jgi:DNA polymerase elongation subunit (family B)
MGQSTTLTGRCIDRHMAAKVNEIIAGEYDYKGDAVIYADTDSAYFSAYPILKKDIHAGNIKWDKDTAIEFYDAVSEEVNQSFPHYMRTNHNSPDSFNYTIAAGREVVGRTGIFITKKRYAILVYDTEGFREDQNGKPGKIKAMGLDLKRSDTPVFMQNFLKEILLDVLTGANQQAVIEKVRAFRQEFKRLKPWEMGTPKRVNNLTAYYNKEFKVTKSGKEEYLGKANMPGHVRAAINYNRLRAMNNDNFSMKIVDGMKTVVCKLKPNALNITSIAIPTDESRIPDWFKALPFDMAEMEDTILDQKLMNLLDVLNWDMSQSKMSESMANLFDFE